MRHRTTLRFYCHLEYFPYLILNTVQVKQTYNTMLLCTDNIKKRELGDIKMNLKMRLEVRNTAFVKIYTQDGKKTTHRVDVYNVYRI